MSNSNQIESGNEVSDRRNALKAEAKEIMPVSIFAQGLFNLFNPSEEFIQDDTFEAEAKEQAEAEAIQLMLRLKLKLYKPSVVRLAALLAWLCNFAF